MTLSNKVVAVTGGTAGIGFQIALKAVEQGAAVIVAGRDPTRGSKAVAELQKGGGEALFVQADIGRGAEAARQIVDSAVTRFGSLYLVVNNAAQQNEASLEDTSELDQTQAESVLATNLVGPLMLVRYALPVMRLNGEGVVVNIASVVGTRVYVSGALLYGISKAALVSASALFAAQEGDGPLRFYTVCPWITDTPAVDAMSGHDESAKLAFAAANNPSGRIVPPVDVAEVVIGLAAGTIACENGGATTVDAGPRLERMRIAAELLG